MNNSDNENISRVSSEKQSPFAWAGSICLIIGLAAAGLGGVMLTNDHYVLGWVLIGVGVVLFVGGIGLLRWKLHAGRIKV